MTKRMEDMTREEILREFQGGDVVMRMPRRPKKLVPLTLRVSPDLRRRLGEEAKRCGVAGHTTIARMLLEQAVRATGDSLADQIADKVLAKIGGRLKKTA